MPQLDISTYLPQLFWLAASFLVLYLLMKVIALPQVDAALKARRSRIDDDLTRAGELKTQAEAVLGAYEKSLAEARSQAQAVLKEGAERLAAEAARRQRELAQKLAAEAEAAEREIAAAKERAFRDMENVTRDLARAVAERLTGAPLPAPSPEPPEPARAGP